MTIFVCLQCGKRENAPGHLGENVCVGCRRDRARAEQDARHERAAAAKHRREIERLHGKQVAQQQELLDLRKRELRSQEARERHVQRSGSGASDALKGLVVLVVGVGAIGWYGWAAFFRRPDGTEPERTVAEPTASATATPAAAAPVTTAPPPESTPRADASWCVCFREGDGETIMDVTACRASESACERLERSARSQSGSRSILPNSLIHECVPVASRVFEEAGWQRSSVADGWVWNGECRLDESSMR